jgi:hypothetical protein
MKMIDIWKRGGIQKSGIRQQFESSPFSQMSSEHYNFREKGLLSKSHPFREESSILGKNRRRFS